MTLTLLVRDVLAFGQSDSKRETRSAESAAREATWAPKLPQPKIDEQAYRMLYRRTAGALRAYAARVMGNASHADDIVQESYLRLVRTPPATDDKKSVADRVKEFLRGSIRDRMIRGVETRNRPTAHSPFGYNELPFTLTD